MIRLLGAVLFLASSFTLGTALRRIEAKHIAALAEALSVVRHAGRKIELFGTPLGVLFTDYSENPQLAERLRSLPLQTALVPLLTYMREDGEIMRRFCAEIGVGYREDATKCCDYTAKLLSERLAVLRKTYPSHARLYTALPVLLALSVILLFA